MMVGEGRFSPDPRHNKRERITIPDPNMVDTRSTCTCRTSDIIYDQTGAPRKHERTVIAARCRVQKIDIGVSNDDAWESTTIGNNPLKEIKHVSFMNSVGRVRSDDMTLKVRSLDMHPERPDGRIVLLRFLVFIHFL